MTGVTASDNIVQGNLLVGGDITNPISAKLSSDKTGIDDGLRYDFGGNARTLPLSVGAWEYDGIIVTPLPPTATRTPTPRRATRTPTRTAMAEPTGICIVSTWIPESGVTITYSNCK